MQTHPLSYILFVRTPLLILLVLITCMGVFSRRGLMDWRRIQDQNAILQRKTEALNTQKQEWVQEVHALEQDPTEQERVVRSVLGYVKNNETVIEFE